MTEKTKIWIFLFCIFLSNLISSTSSQNFERDCFLKSRPLLEPENCDVYSRYRTISGRCNNLQNPEWGSAGSMQIRILPADYKDGISVPRGGHSTSSLPNPRWISMKNHPDLDDTDPRFTHMLMQFGQFLDHDLALAPKDETIDCCTTPIYPDKCFTILIPNEDRFFSWVNSSVWCLNFVRSQPLCGTAIREQYNKPTAYIDASNVYGSEQEYSALLRTYSDGKLHQNKNNDQLPTRLQLNVRPNRGLLRPQTEYDFMAGDDRVNEHPFLSSMHLIFQREHNRIVELLKEYLPPHLRKDEILYQETRRIVSAEFQNIVYGEFLPSILGGEYMRRYDLYVREETKYDPSVDASIINSFANAAFRFGHSMINGMFKLVAQRHNSTKETDNKTYWLWRLREIFDGQSINGATLPLENMIEGLLTQKPQTCDAFFTTEITDHLFQRNSHSHNFGEDLLAINIQRGRDHGLPSYTKYRELCGLDPLISWYNKPREYTEAYWEKLQNVYKNVEDIDLFVGAIAEIPVDGGAIGPTFACIIGIQFSLLQKGDRFFYTHRKDLKHHVQGLDRFAKEEIVARKLSDIICDNTQLQEIQKWATLQPHDEYNSITSCQNKKSLNIQSIAAEIEASLSSPPHASLSSLSFSAKDAISNSQRFNSYSFL